MFGSTSDSSLPPLIAMSDGLVCESVGKAEMQSANLMEISPTLSLTTFAFRSREVKRLLLDLDSCGGTVLFFFEEDS